MERFLGGLFLSGPLHGDLFLGELLLRGTALWLISALALRLLRSSTASHRHLICVLALFGLAALPAVRPWMPALPLLPAPRSVARSASLEALPSPAARTGAVPDQASPKEPAREPSTVPGPRGHTVPPAVGLASAPRGRWHLGMLLGFLWALGTAVLLTRLAVALFRLRRLSSGGRAATIDDVPVQLSDRVRSPLTWGVWKSVILLPAELASQAPNVCVSAVRHERAHVVRWDWIWNLFAEVVCACQWFQPGAWWLRARMRSESERACDDHVLLSGVAGPEYAEQLLRVLQSTSSREVAPAMAGTCGMEERMRHILDDRRARRAPVSRLASTIPVMLALLTLAALRVTVKPAAAEAERAPLSAPLIMPTDPAVPPAILSEPAATTLSAPAATSLPATFRAMDPGPSIAADGVVRASEPQTAVGLSEIAWGKVVDGWEPGFQLLAPPGARKRDLPLNCRVEYRVLVRNRTSRDRILEVHCDRNNAYLVPGGVRPDPLKSGEVPDQFRAQGVTDFSVVPGAFNVKVEPGEAIVVPVELSLAIGASDPSSYPRVQTAVRGNNWLIHTLDIHALTPEEAVPAEAAITTPYSDKRRVTTIDRNGKFGQRNAWLLGARAPTTRLVAGIRIELGSAQAEEAAGPVPIAWGKVDKGLQCGLRMLNAKPSYSTGDLLEAEIYYRNVTGKSIYGPIPRPTDLYPLIHDASGHEIMVDLGARIELIGIWQEFPAQEVRRLGVTQVALVSREARVPPEMLQPARVALEPGEYRFSALGGISAPKGGSPESARIPFRVARNEKATSAPTTDGIAWGEEWHGLRLGLRLPKGVAQFPQLSEARFEVLLQNRSDHRQTCDWMGYPTINQFEPELFTAAGKQIRYVHTIAGPYMNDGSRLAPGEMQVMGTISIPHEEAEVVNAFHEGTYRAEFSLHVTLPDKKSKSLEARIPFRVGR